MPTYQGHCHCGAVEFEMTTDTPITEGARCNCSQCRRKGVVMVYTRFEQFKVTKGDSELSEYQWNTHKAHHFFCRHCGIYTHHQPRTKPDKMGVNAGCIDALDPLSLNVDIRDGAALSTEG